METIKAYAFDGTSGKAVLLGIIDDYQTLRFARSYSGIGTWELAISAHSECGQRIRGMQLLQLGPARAGLVTSVQAVSDQAGTCTITYAGTELKGLAGRRIIYPPADASHQTITAPVEDVMAALISVQITDASAARRIPGTIAAHASAAPRIAYSARYAALQEELATLADQYGIGWYADIGDRTIIWHIYTGVDRRVGADNSTLLLSYARGTIDGSQYNYAPTVANTAITAGQGEGVERAISVVGDDNAGLDRVELYVDARDVQDAGLLPDRGRQYLAQQGTEITYRLQASSQLIRGYRVDWDLGDQCTVRDELLLDTDLHSRVTQVTEIYEDGRLQLEIGVGYDKQRLADVLQRARARTQALINKEG